MGGIRRNRAKTGLRGPAVGGGGRGVGKRCPEKTLARGRGPGLLEAKGGHALTLQALSSVGKAEAVQVMASDGSCCMVT